MKALIFAHFDPHGIVDDYVLFSLKCYRQYFDVVIFVTVCDLDMDQIGRAHRNSDMVLIRPNLGYDFMSWRTGYERLKIEQFSSVTFANDSCYGPLVNIGPALTSAELSHADMWGISLNHQFGRHIQSFFMMFKSNILQHIFFKRFWTSIQQQKSKHEVILNYEVMLSRRIEELGFRLDGLIEYPTPNDLQKQRVYDGNITRDQSNRQILIDCVLNESTPNPMIFYWSEAIKDGCPLLKIQILRALPTIINLQNVKRVISNETDYNFHMIRDHLSRVAPEIML